ncbi:MAG: hypothetical protein A2X86_11020 [Bdellovibrionales bacterium GWA2_49_15]|nr:MAG: hypothetical protein A2X86_11020 [Bdellovibrionales bacterium GWA2_49_15]
MKMKIIFLILGSILAVNDVRATDNEAFIQAISSANYAKVKMMIAEGAEVNAEANGRWPLETAVFNGNIALASLLLDSGAVVDQKGNLGATPLATAAGMFGQLAMVKLLVEKGANVNAEDNFGETPLSAASRNENSAIVSYLVKNGARAISQKCNSALFNASHEGMLRNVKILLSNFKEIINFKNKNGDTALLNAAKGGRFQVYKYLLSQGAVSSIADRDGNNLLINAVKGGNYWIVQDLLNRGLDPNYRNINGETALMHAAFSGNVAILQLLLNRGATVNVTGRSSHDTALHPAIIGQQSDLRTLWRLVPQANLEYRRLGMLVSLNHNKLEASKIFYSYLNRADRAEYRQKAIMIAAEKGYLTLLKYYADQGGNLTAQDSEGNTPLMLAARFGNFETLKYLVQKNVPLETKDKGSRTASTLAAEFYELGILKSLKAKGADLNVLDQKNQTILMRVVGTFAPPYHSRFKRELMVAYLIKENNIDAQDSAGETALMKAIRGQNELMVRQLIEACANQRIENKQFLSAASVAHHYAPTMVKYLYPPANPVCRKVPAILASKGR